MAIVVVLVTVAEVVTAALVVVVVRKRNVRVKLKNSQRKLMVEGGKFPGLAIAGLLEAGEKGGRGKSKHENMEEHAT